MSLPAASGGTDLSMVTTGEKYTWNNKVNNSMTSENFASNKGHVYKFGKVVFLRISGTFTVSAWGSLGTVPSGYRPPIETPVNPLNDISYYIAVKTDGTLVSSKALSNASVDLFATYVIN